MMKWWSFIFSKNWSKTFRKVSQKTGTTTKTVSSPSAGKMANEWAASNKGPLVHKGGKNYPVN